MDVEFSEEQIALGASVRRVLADHASIETVRADYGNPSAPDDAWPRLAGLGLVGLSVTDLGLPLQECGRALYRGPVAAVTAAHALVTYLDPADPLLAEIDGGTIVVTAVHEPKRRWSLRPELMRERADRLTGLKCAVPDAGPASTLLVTAAADDGGVGVYAVGTDSATLELEESTDGSRFWDGVRLDDAPARRIGGHAEAALVRFADRMAVAYACDGLGAADRALELALDYAKTREQFGKPIGSFQAVQQLCADMLTDLELSRAAVHYALWALDQPDHHEAHRAAVQAKAATAELLPRVGAGAIQVFGGVGFTWEHDAHRYYKRLLSMSTAYGDAAAAIDELARLVL